MRNLLTGKETLYGTRPFLQSDFDRSRHDPFLCRNGGPCLLVRIEGFALLERKRKLLIETGKGRGYPFPSIFIRGDQKGLFFHRFIDLLLDGLIGIISLASSKQERRRHKKKNRNEPKRSDGFDKIRHEGLLIFGVGKALKTSSCS